MVITTTASGSSTSGPASCRVASIPSSPGMRTSNKHVGTKPAGKGDRVAAVGGPTDDFDAGLGLEDHGEPGADDVLVVGDEHADGHAMRYRISSSAAAERR